MRMRDLSPVRIRMLAVIAALLALGLLGRAQERDRARIPDKYKWNLADVYPSEAAWRSAKDKLAAEIPQLGRFRGRLGTSAQTLADALEKMSALNKELDRLFVYAGASADQDTRDSAQQGMKQEMVQLSSS